MISSIFSFNFSLWLKSINSLLIFSNWIPADDSLISFISASKFSVNVSNTTVLILSSDISSIDLFSKARHTLSLINICSEISSFRELNNSWFFSFSHSATKEPSLRKSKLRSLYLVFNLSIFSRDNFKSSSALLFRRSQ